MATTISKQQTLHQLFKEEGLADPGPCDELGVLEQFIFALCRENATTEQARQAYQNLRTQFFDWNEIRVSTPREIEDALAGLGDAESRAQRLLSFLQEVFETHFCFDLERLHKEGVKVAAKQLMKYGAANDYVGAWVIQRSLGGHAIPVDAPTLRCARRLGLVEASTEDPESVRTALEHAVQKTKGSQFTDVISNLAERFCWEGEPSCPNCPMARNCPTAREGLSDELATARTARAKPR